MFKAPRCKQICTNEVLDNIAVPWIFLGGEGVDVVRVGNNKAGKFKNNMRSIFSLFNKNDIKDKLKQRFHLPTP